MNEIVTLASSPSNAVRSHGFPVLEAGNLSFPDGRYAPSFELGKDRTSFVLKHHVEGAPLISRLIGEGDGRYVCAVSSPKSSYRETHVSSDPSQQIRWDIDYLGEPPLFTPMIVSVASLDLRLDRDRDGVHEVWHNQRVVIEKGSRLALGSVVQLQSSILHMLSFHEAEQLKEGMFVVEAETEPFRFRVNLHPDLHRFLKPERKVRTRNNIMIHIVTACLALLQREFQDKDDDGWKAHRNLRAFADFLESKNQPHWTDEDSFKPEQVATSLYPLSLPPEEEEES